MTLYSPVVMYFVEAQNNNIFLNQNLCKLTCARLVRLENVSHIFKGISNIENVSNILIHTLYSKGL